jgi:hypothetical protein
MSNPEERRDLIGTRVNANLYLPLDVRVVMGLQATCFATQLALIAVRREECAKGDANSPPAK